MNEWVMLNITLPQKPSRPRVNAWRRLKGLGAANIGQSSWVLPFSERHEDEFNRLAVYARECGGKAFVSRSDFIGAEDEQTITAYFNADRDAEYGELFEQCDCFFAEIEKETERKNFSFAELEENEQELEKLSAWLEKIKARDFFTSALNGKAEETLKECRAELDKFAENIFLSNEDKI